MSIQVILSILLENECDFGTVATESVSARIRVNLERTLLGRGAKDMLHWIWIFCRLRRERGNVDTVRDEETRVEPKSERSNEVTGSCPVGAAALRFL